MTDLINLPTDYCPNCGSCGGRGGRCAKVTIKLADDGKFVSIPIGHDCMENAVPYTSDGALGHGFECGVCGVFLQAG